MRIATCNVNGLRAVLRKGFADWCRAQEFDVLCLQETKVQLAQHPALQQALEGYSMAYADAQKPGYSGVAILSRAQPLRVATKLGIAPMDDEGRYVRADFADFSVISMYLPSGTTGSVRQDVKFACLEALAERYMSQWLHEDRPVLLCGDWNMVHTALDIARWQQNQQTSGCLPEERAWIASMLGLGWTDVFRHLHPDTRAYSWWTYRAGAREKNIGWRIDYQWANLRMQSLLESCMMHKDPVFSDHAVIEAHYELGGQ